ncbi:unnamed protein product [Rhizophagus irregularis]|nr:unnamed protein product [Rhizophagus irregularis]
MVKGILKAQIQQLLSFDEIPLHFKSQDRLMNASKKLWMLEETILPIIDIINIIDHCPFLEEIHQLEHGFIITINNKKYWLTGGLGIITADLPQGNDIAGILRHNAKHGCRSCYAAKEDLTNISFDTILNGRYHQITNIQFKEIQELNSNNIRTQRSTIKSEYLTATKERLSLPHQNSVIKKLVKTWALVAKASKEVFSNIILRSEYYDNLTQALNNEHHALLEMFPASFENLPNLHINRHLVDHARNYGTCINIYLANGGLDDQGQQSTIFAKIMADPKLKVLLSGWYIKNHNLSIHSNEEESLDDVDNDKNSGKIFYYFYQ